MSYSIGWGLFALTLVVAGIWKRIRAARYAGIALLGVTVVKLFTHDLANLGQLYRIGALLGVAVVAIAASFFYQRFFADDSRQAAAKPDAKTPPPSQPGMSFMKARDTLVAAVVLLALSARAATFSEWQWRQPLPVSSPGLLKLSLPESTLDAARPDLGDLRWLTLLAMRCPIFWTGLFPPAKPFKPPILSSGVER